MKFGTNLQAHLTPEWRSQYIDYEVLKNMLYECKDEISTLEDQLEDTTRSVAQFEENFFAQCDLQLTKVNTFFAEKMAETTRRFVFLQSELQAHKNDVANVAQAVTNLTLRRRVTQANFLAKTEHKVRIKTTKDLKLAFSEFYLNLVLLQNFQELNFTGFRKILKKHDKMLNTDKGATWRVECVESAPFHTDSLISDYITKTENSFINDLENGDRAKAMKRLRVPPLTDTTTYPKGTVFRVGLFLGMFIIIVAVAFFAGIYVEIEADPWLIVDLFRGGLLLLVFLTCIGFNIWGWRTAGVNHILIFEIDPRQHLSHQHFFEVSSMFSIIWGLGLIAFLFGDLPIFSAYPVYLSPGLVGIVFLAFFLNPFPVFFHKARLWLLKRLWRLFACGFYPVEFADFWIADQLTSLAALLLDIEFLICFYAFDGDIFAGIVDETDRVCHSYSYGVRAVLACYPSFIRFVQCLRRYRDSKKWFPHLVNAGKYSTTFFRETFKALYVLHSSQTQMSRSVYFYLYVASLFINSSYTLAWDLKMDWGFLDRNAGENRFLREEIVYPNKTLYYLAIIENSIIRFAWIVKISIEQTLLGPQSDSVRHIVSTVLSFLEVFRRFVWNFFRLENEHLNNCGEFRAVRDISFTPIRADELFKMEKMMDEKDGAEKILLCNDRSKKRVLSSRKSVPIMSKFTSIPRRGSVAVMKFFSKSKEPDPATSTSPV